MGRIDIFVNQEGFYKDAMPVVTDALAASASTEIAEELLSYFLDTKAHLNSQFC
jgi:hypothetical protein